jgi:hypothetical protein
MATKKETRERRHGNYEGHYRTEALLDDNISEVVMDWSGVERNSRS